MSPEEARATMFTELVAHVQPDPGNACDRLVINTARLIARALHEAGLGQYEPPPLPVSASGIPITRRKV